MRSPLDFLAGIKRDYGDIAYFSLGGVGAYFLSHPDYVRDVMFAQRTSFTLSPLREKLIPVIGLGLFTSKGELHQRQKRLMLPVFRKSRVDAYAECMSNLTQRTRDKWRPGSEIDIAEETMALTMFIAGKTLFDHDIEGDSDAVSENLAILLEYFTRMMSPFLRLSLMVPLPSTLRFRRAVRDFDTVIYRMIEQRRAAGGGGEDLLGLLMAATDDETKSHMTLKQLRDELVTLLIAGHETTANLIAWTLYLLGQAPEADQRLYDEVKALLGDRAAFTAADPERMPYARKILMEGLRLYPPGWFVGRAALSDVKLGEYTLPKGGVVPERWTKEFMEQLPRGAYYPFSGGDRHCIGEGFAWQEALLILATLIERWRFELVPGQDIRVRPSVTLRPDRPIRMIVRPRD
jgi:cytochrome P450